MAAAHFTLNTGARVPSVGLGTYKAAPGVVADVVAAAVKVFVLLHAHVLF
jgi:diketogulonate reductase-like aldo/keto reductase